MTNAARDEGTLDFRRAAELLEKHWQAVVEKAGEQGDARYLEDAALREAIRASVNHKLVHHGINRSTAKRPEPYLGRST